MATGQKVWLAVVVRVVQGHVLDVLAREPAQSVHCCVTSPPFWKLRAYGTEPQTWADGWLGELGQEETPERFVSHLVDVFRAVKRVLRDDGCCFVNLSDTYWSDPGGQNGTTGNVSARAITANTQAGRQDRTRVKHDRLKSGDLCEVPSLFATAMQRDGWVLRSRICWIKTSPLPESVSGTAWQRCRVKVAKGVWEADPSKGANPSHRTSAALAARSAHAGAADREQAAGQGAEWADCPGCPKCAANEGLVLRRGSGRPTSAYELIFMFTKNMGGYFWDQESVRVGAAPDTLRRAANAVGGTKFDASRSDGGPAGLASRRIGDFAGGRNAWNWMTFKPAPSSLAHYAGYPPQLPEFCIKAGTSQAGVCPKCLAPHARIISRAPDNTGYANGPGGSKRNTTPFAPGEKAITGTLAEVARYDTTTLGWRPTCPPACHQGLPPRPATVLDLFGGSGTTGLVADRLGRDAILVDLKDTYVELSRKRLIGDAPLFMDVSVEGATDVPPVEVPDDPLTKQERHPNRTVAGFNQRWKDKHGAIGVDTEGAAAG